MILNTYNPIDMSLVGSDISRVDFGGVVKGQHNSSPVVLKPILEPGASMSRLALYLENSGGLGHSQFGKYKNQEAITGLMPGSDQLSDHFTVQEGISDFINFESTSDYGIVLNPEVPEYLWLDVQAGNSENRGVAQVNFRFIFEYN